MQDRGQRSRDFFRSMQERELSRRERTKEDFPDEHDHHDDSRRAPQRLGPQHLAGRRRRGTGGGWPGRGAGLAAGAAKRTDH